MPDVEIENMKANVSRFRRPGGMSMEEFERLHNAYKGVWQDTFTVREEVRTRPHLKSNALPQCRAH